MFQKNKKCHINNKFKINILNLITKVSKNKIQVRTIKYCYIGKTREKIFAEKGS